MQVSVAHRLMMFGWVMFGKIIGMIGSAQAPKDVTLTLACAVTYPVNCMSIAFDLFCFTMSLMMPQAVSLSVWSRVAACGWLSSSNVIHKGQAAWALRKSAPSSASTVLATTWHMIWQRMWTGPSLGGAGSVATGAVCGWELRK